MSSRLAKCCETMSTASAAGTGRTIYVSNSGEPDIVVCQVGINQSLGRRFDRVIRIVNVLEPSHRHTRGTASLSTRCEYLATSGLIEMRHADADNKDALPHWRPRQLTTPPGA